MVKRPSVPNRRRRSFGLSEVDRPLSAMTTVQILANRT